MYNGESDIDLNLYMPLRDPESIGLSIDSPRGSVEEGILGNSFPYCLPEGEQTGPRWSI